ncbi:MAG: hypothetical protein ACJ8FI_11620 [Sphingomicrobium sp.]|jgi:hypothetical protein
MGGKLTLVEVADLNAVIPAATVLDTFCRRECATFLQNAIGPNEREHEKRKGQQDGEKKAQTTALPWFGF